MDIEVFKCIFYGRLDFGKERSYQQVVEFYENRTINHYRNLVAIKAEDYFNEENLSLEVAPRVVLNISKKQWANTIALLKFAAGFAVAGQFDCWMLENGKVLAEFHIEPNNDKRVVQTFLKGRQLVKTEGKEQEAIDTLNKVIGRHEKHALAYERRGKVQVMLGNYKDALYDYTKSINYNPHNPEPYVGRAFIHMRSENWAEARKDLISASRNSIPHQDIYWKAIRVKAEMEIKLGNFDAAEKDLHRFLKRNFAADSPNQKFRKLAFTNYGIALREQDKIADAIEQFDQAAEIEQGDLINPAEPLFQRGITRKRAGMRGYKTDLKKAAEMGSEAAAELLATK